MATGFDGDRSRQAARSVRVSERYQRGLPGALFDRDSTCLVQHVARDRLATGTAEVVGQYRRIFLR